jgi:hypothetical protein
VSPAPSRRLVPPGHRSRRPRRPDATPPVARRDHGAPLRRWRLRQRLCRPSRRAGAATRPAHRPVPWCAGACVSVASQGRSRPGPADPGPSVFGEGRGSLGISWCSERSAMIRCGARSATRGCVSGRSCGLALVTCWSGWRSTRRYCWSGPRRGTGRRTRDVGSWRGAGDGRGRWGHGWEGRAQGSAVRCAWWTWASLSAGPAGFRAGENGRAEAWDGVRVSKEGRWNGA